MWSGADEAAFSQATALLLRRLQAAGLPSGVARNEQLPWHSLIFMIILINKILYEGVVNYYRLSDNGLAYAKLLFAQFLKTFQCTNILPVAEGRQTGVLL